MARELQIRSAVHLMFLRAQAPLRVRLVVGYMGVHSVYRVCVSSVSCQCIVSVYRVSVSAVYRVSVFSQCIRIVPLY